jgi:leucyl aminopeptidase
MVTVQNAATVEVLAVQLSAVETELLIQPVFEEEPLPGGDSLVLATAGEVSRASTSGEFKGKLYDLFFTPIVDRRWKARRIVLAGLGRRSDYSVDRVRRVATAAGLAARQRRHERVGMIWTDPRKLEHTSQAIVEGLILANFDAAQYKTDRDRQPRLRGLHIVLAPDARYDARKTASAAAERGRITGESCNAARAFANEPGNTLTPRVFAERAAALASEARLAVDVLDEHRIADLGMGLLLGVSRGSVEPPRVIVLRHSPPGAPTAPVLGLVGKGITFDSGGISIKPADGMERMKDDMAGGAAVICAMSAISLLNAPIPVVGVVPTTENMPGGRALKPGDILRGASGKTVEVVNTDAEGRLILGDGLWYAQRLGATHLVDVATLTGACVVALGKITSGLFGRPSEWVDVIRRAAEHAGDRIWPMPLFEEYRDQLRSDIADLTNTGGRPAGAITAAMFLKEFAGSFPWAHLDIAGTAWADEPQPYLPRGASGVAVRTLIELPWTSNAWPR